MAWYTEETIKEIAEEAKECPSIIDSAIDLCVYVKRTYKRNLQLEGANNLLKKVEEALDQSEKTAK